MRSLPSLCMFFAKVLLLFATTTTVGASLAEYWNIADPTYDYNDNVFRLKYVFNDLVDDGMIKWTYYDENCQSGGGVELESSGIGYDFETSNDLRPNGSGSSVRQNNLSFQPTSDIYKNELIYFGDSRSGEDWEATVKLCARVSLYTDNGIEVNFQENIINIQYVFTAGILLAEDVSVVPPLINLQNVELGVKLKATDCSQSNGEGKLTQGMTIRVCIEPVAQAVRDGFRMKAIEWFEYSKSEYDTITQEWDEPFVTQEVVVDRVQSSNDLSVLICDQGSIQCSVETMLIGPFYLGEGSVDAQGLATMQLGSHSSDADAVSRSRNRRNLRTKRELQEANDEDDEDDDEQSIPLPETVEQEFEVPITVVPNTDEQLNNDGSDDGSSSSSNVVSKGSKPVTIVIIVLGVLNILTIVIMLLQLPIFRGKFVYLGERKESMTGKELSFRQTI